MEGRREASETVEEVGEALRGRRTGEVGKGEVRETECTTTRSEAVANIQGGGKGEGREGRREKMYLGVEVRENLVGAGGHALQEEGAGMEA